MTTKLITICGHVARAKNNYPHYYPMVLAILLFRIKTANYTKNKVSYYRSSATMSLFTTLMGNHLVIIVI